jgi:NADH:ubiquinone oxidoreductase subunit 2 (subunit N)
LSGIFASNLLTLAVAWGLLDLLFVLALLVRGGAEVGRRAALAIVLNAVSTVCVWIAALLIESEQGSLYWHLLDAPAAARAWLMAAAVLRVGLYPFHQWLPVELSKEPDRAVMIFVAPTAAGLALWARLADARALPENSIVALLSTLSVVIGAVLAWRSAQPRRGLPFIILGLSGYVGLLAASAATGSLLTAAALNWIFVVESLFITRGLNRRQPFWSTGALIAGLSLAALPGTLGFVVQQAIITATLQAKQWFILIAVVIAQTVLITATARLIFSEPAEGTPQLTIRKISWGAAIVLGALPLITFAFMPELLPGLPSIGTLLSELNAIGLVALLAPMIIAPILAWRGPRPTSSGEAWQTAWGRILRLEWLNNAVFYVIDRLTGLLRAVAALFESEGGLLWTVVFIVIVIVIYSGALQL